MKTLLITLTILLLSGGGMWYITNYPKPELTEISVLRDITSPHLSQPKAEDIIPLFNLSQNIWNGYSFRFSDLSDLSLNQDTNVSIDGVNKWVSNELDRENAINGFKGKVEQIITEAQNDTIGRWHSSLYLPIATELNRLSQIPAQRRILLVYSDLMENDPSYSFYSPITFALFQKSPDKVLKHFEKEAPLNDLKGIQVYLIYQPMNTVDDNQYRIVSGFYKSLLESYGATVSISANLTN